MSIASEITRINNNIANAYTQVNSKGGTLPATQNSNNLANAISSIPQSGGGDIDWSGIGYSGTPQSVQDGYDYAKTIYDNWDSSQLYFNSKFVDDKSLIFMPLVDTSNGISFSSMFQNCTSLTTVPQLNTSNGSSFNSMFNNCTLLTTVPQLNTSNGTRFNSMFYYCLSLTTVPQLDTSSGTNFNNIVYICPSLTTFGGLKNIGQAYLTSQSANYSNYNLNLSACSLLTHDSLMNVINNLYDIATKGCNTQQLILGSTNLAKLSAEEIAIATNKGWSIS